MDPREHRATSVPACRARRVMVLSLVALALVAAGALPASAATKEQLASQLADLKQDVKRAGAAFETALWRLENADDKVRATDREIARTTHELAAARELLGRRVAAMYRTGGAPDYIAVVLGSDTFDEMVTRVEYMRRVGQADADAIKEVERLEAALRAQRAKLTKDRKDQARAVSRLRKQRDALERNLRAKQAAYEKAAARAGVAARGASVRGRPKGPNGMVFPVQGVCYYSNTWGAARSGGRSHKGTDIMAARGTPCVAVLSGTVRSRSGGLGGKTIWLTASNGWQFYYAHLDRWAVTSGRVSAGQVIGYVGSTGNARGGSPHLHFEIHPGGGGAVNPYPYLRAME